MIIEREKTPQMQWRVTCSRKKKGVGRGTRGRRRRREEKRLENTVPEREEGGRRTKVCSMYLEWQSKKRLK